MTEYRDHYQPRRFRTVDDLLARLSEDERRRLYIRLMDAIAAAPPLTRWQRLRARATNLLRSWRSR